MSDDPLKLPEHPVLRPTNSTSLVTERALQSPLPSEWNDVEARPLGQSEWNTVTPKNTSLHFAWVNHKYNGGVRYEQRREQGYRKATQADCSNIMWKDQERAFVHGDLILMCLPKTVRAAADKHNFIRANSLALRNMQAEAARMSAIGRGTPNSGKIAGYIPTPEEVAKVVK